MFIVINVILCLWIGVRYVLKWNFNNCVIFVVSTTVHSAIEYIYSRFYKYLYLHTYRVICKSLQDFQPLRFSSRDGQAEGEHVSRGRDTPSFCPTLRVLEMSTLGDAADVNPVIKFLPHTCNVCGRNLIIGLTSAACATMGSHLQGALAVGIAVVQ